MNLLEVLCLLYPQADPITDFQVGDRGNGPEIVVWNLSDPKPDSQQIQTWLEDIKLQDQYNQKQKDIINAPIIEQLDKLDLKSIRALRTNDSTRLIDYEQQAVVLRSKLIK